jgi:hypothetical protein
LLNLHDTAEILPIPLDPNSETQLFEVASDGVLLWYVSASTI